MKKNPKSAGAGNGAGFQGKAYRHPQRATGHTPRAVPAARRQHTASRGQDEDGERRGHVSHGVPGERREGAPGGGGWRRLKKTFQMFLSAQTKSRRRSFTCPRERTRAAFFLCTDEHRSFVSGTLVFRCFIVGAWQGRLFRSCFPVVRRVFGGVGGQEADLCAETAILCSLVGLNFAAIRVRARDQRAVLRRSRWASLRRTWYRTSHGARNLSRKAPKTARQCPL